eukprot:4319482-Amphidinium_carterae.2
MQQLQSHMHSNTKHRCFRYSKVRSRRMTCILPPGQQGELKTHTTPIVSMSASVILERASQITGHVHTGNNTM